MIRFLTYCILFFSLINCKKENSAVEKTVVIDEIFEEEEEEEEEETIQLNDYYSILKSNSEYISDGFDFPIGKPNARGYYNAQKFQENDHLGDDWNGVGGGNSDLGDSIYSIANGYISEVKDYEGGWGNIVRIVHLHNDKLYESLYAHCDSILISTDTFIKKGEQIATIGNCNGIYFAHLHLEIRDTVGLSIGGGYSDNTTGYLDPTKFINKNRN